MSTPGKCGPSTPTHRLTPTTRPLRSLTGGAGRSTQCGICAGQAGLAPRRDSRVTLGLEIELSTPDRAAWTVSARPHAVGAASSRPQRGRPLGDRKVGVGGVSRRRPRWVMGVAVGRDGCVTPVGPARRQAHRSSRGGACAQRAEQALGADVDLSPFAAMAAADPLLGPLAARMREQATAIPHRL